MSNDEEIRTWSKVKDRLTSDPVCMTEKLICYGNKRAEKEATVVSNVGRVVREC